MFFFELVVVETIGAYIGSSLSILGAILTFWFSRYVSLKIFPFKHYLTTLSFFDFLIGVILFIPGRNLKNFCLIQPTLVCFIWSIPIGFSAMLSTMIYFNLAKGWGMKKLTKIILPPGVFIVGLVAVATSLVYYYYGEAGVRNTNWCWIGPEQWQLILVMYIPYWTFTAICLTMGIALWRFFIKQTNQDIHTKGKARRWIIFPVCVFFTIFFTSYKRIRQIIDWRLQDLHWLDFFQGLMTPLVGFFDFILFYLLDPQIRTTCFKEMKSQAFDNNNEHEKTQLLQEGEYPMTQSSSEDDLIL
ncbi:g protein-coupled receptor [Anaeramoeba flamelloides]|uniref:G protein-coupled receptor n=1 Tax=Anaeramoeba flamelloides TaxID=1746091 RepID=A0AAV8A0A4_9EUKA|nr:g protein-coupled receptor [Anaeramoeba flamelloides]KAJ6250215.1 g protein-coupled receptor [Anaeramoeba flamelloides]